MLSSFFLIYQIARMFLVVVCKTRTDKLFFVETDKVGGLKTPINQDYLFSKLHLQPIDRTRVLNFSGMPENIAPEHPLTAPKRDLISYYREKGESFFYNYSGNWNITLWDHQKQELLVARDKSGTKSIYYYNSFEYFILSDELSVLLGLDFVPKELNHNALIQLGSSLKRDAQTFYKGINQLPAAHYLRLKLRENKVSLHNYWLPEAKPGAIQYQRLDDYVEHFLEIYNQAIIDSLRNVIKPGISLSSGLDSSSIFALATTYLNEEHQKMDAITWQPDVIDKQLSLPGRTLNESKLVKKLVDGRKNTNLHIVKSERGNIISLHRQLLDFCHQPVINLQPHMMEVFARGKSIGIDVMLNGFAGNWTVSYAGSSTYSNSSLEGWVSYAKALLKPLLKKTPYNANNDYIRKEAIRETMSSYNGLTPELEKKRQAGRERYAQVMNTMQSTMLQDVSTYTQQLGFESRTPVMDDRLVDFCLSLPNEVFSKDGNRKRLIRTAMKDKIPNEILFNRKRGLQGANYCSKMKHESLAINELLREFEDSYLARFWLDLDLMKHHFHIYTHAKTTKQLFKANVNIILRGLQVGLFLQRFEDGKY